MKYFFSIFEYVKLMRFPLPLSPQPFPMKKHFILLMSCFLFPILMYAQLNITWQNIIDDGASGNENSGITVYDPNGYVYTIGIMLPSGMNNTDLVIVKYDAIGNELWRTFLCRSGREE
jgi:hypothetical protein